MGDDAVQREMLPIPDRQPVSLTTYDARDPDTSFPPIRPLRPPAGAPNVLVVLDDVGFGPPAPSVGRTEYYANRVGSEFTAPSLAL